MKPPFFTIITVSLNSGATITRTLDSVRNQKFHDLEHIVVDGGSTDQTLKLLKNYQNTYNMTWISEPDKGIADALNKGVARARGRYLLVIQADDALIDNQALKRANRLIQPEIFDIHAFPVAWPPWPQGQVVKKPLRQLWWHRFRNIFPHQGVLVHRRVFDRIGNFDPRFSISMDYDFFYRALLAQCAVRFEDQPLALIGRDGVSSSPADWSRRLREEFQVQDLNEKKLYWRMAQLLFRWFYFAYKTRLAPRLINNP